MFYQIEHGGAELMFGGVKGGMPILDKRRSCSRGVRTQRSSSGLHLQTWSTSPHMLVKGKAQSRSYALLRFALVLQAQGLAELASLADLPAGTHRRRYAVGKAQM
jgi:hypothetical protein